MIFWRIFGDKYCQNLPKIYMNIFHLVANKGLIWTEIITSRINLFAWAIFLYGKCCNMYRIYCLNYILNEWEVKLKNTKLFDRVFQHSIFLNKRIWIIRYFQTHCQLSKFPIRDMPFKTKFTALVNARGLADSASLKIIRITVATLRAIADLKPFLGGVFCFAIYWTYASVYVGCSLQSSFITSEFVIVWLIAIEDCESFLNVKNMLTLARGGYRFITQYVSQHIITWYLSAFNSSRRTHTSLT